MMKTIRASQQGKTLIEFTIDSSIDIGDEYHTIHELYQHRMALNIALFNLIGRGPNRNAVWKSKFHSDGTMFNGDYFITGMQTKFGQISYHYHTKHWDKFKIPEKKKAPRYDGHSNLDVLNRLEKL